MSTGTSKGRDELRALQEAYTECLEAAHGFGLDPGEVEFHVVPAHYLYEVASYGIPGHFSHWSYGRDFWRQKAGYDRGHSRIYELVVNADPAEAFLLDTNSVLENTVVIAHVLGHTHFFRHNHLFSHTNRHMPEAVRTAAERIREYEAAHGRDTVERFLDHAMAVSQQIDPHLLLKRPVLPVAQPIPGVGEFDDLLGAAPLMDEREWRARTRKNPQRPTADLIGFLARFGDLDDWQQDICDILRAEAYYFLPQRLTKIANEGMASIAHRRIIQSLDLEVDPGGVDFASMHAGVMASSPGGLNPYRLGYAVLSRIEERFNTPQERDRERLRLGGGEGWERLLEAVALESDASLLRNYLDEEVVRSLDLFSYDPEVKNDKRTGRAVVANTGESSWEAVRDALVEQVSGSGVPEILVTDGDYKHTGTLLLIHDEARELDVRYAENTLDSVAVLWGRPVELIHRRKGSWHSLRVEDGKRSVSEVRREDYS